MVVILGQCPDCVQGFGIWLDLIYMGTPTAPPREPTVTNHYGNDAFLSHSSPDPRGRRHIITAPIVIRVEQSGDIPHIRDIVAHAFGQLAEADLVDRLRADGDV